MMTLIFPKLFKKNKPIFVATCLFAFLLSCNKQEIETPSAITKKEEPDVALTFDAVLSSSKLLYEETFEGNGPYFYNGGIQSGTSYGFTVTTSTVYQGKKAGRFELRNSDPSTNGGTRAEAKYPSLTNSNRWYSYAVYFPSAYYKYDSEAEIISQWHQGKGASPSISLLTRYDKLYLEIRPSPNNRTQFMLGDIVKDKWHTYVFHILHSNYSNGLVEIWHNGAKIFSQTGKNAYSFSSYARPIWKFGLYKWEWNGEKTTDTKKRIIFFDNIRIGNEKATYSDMVKPAYKSLTPPAVIKSFTLVNAETEKDIMTLNNGAIINLTKLGVTKINIRANPGLEVGSVEFVLSGRQNKIRRDNDAPYALNGDNDKGNYYFGSWDPPPTGKYRLQATAYSKDHAEGLTGTTAVINFTITK